MMVVSKEGEFLEAYDENGVRIGFVNSADPDLGFIVVYDDVGSDESVQKFKLKTLRIRRVYTKFTLGPLKIA
jgi:hypothetical protein